MKKKFCVYILECADETFYTGYSTDVKDRVDTHNAGKGAKYTRGRGPVKLVWTKKYATLSEALKEELRIKKLTKQQKIELIYRKEMRQKNNVR